MDPVPKGTKQQLFFAGCILFPAVSKKYREVAMRHLWYSGLAWKYQHKVAEYKVEIKNSEKEGVWFRVF